MSKPIQKSLKEEVVRSYIPGETSMVDLGRLYNLDRSTIKRILLEAGVKIVYPKTKLKTFGQHGDDKRFKHGMSDRAEFHIWQGMLARCCVSTNRAYRLYGGRGITVCDRWLSSFENFYADMGPRPSPKHSIDRIDNDGNYEPGNCRWTTQKVQCNNRSGNRLLTYKGETKTMQQWADIHNIPYNTLLARIVNYGWAIERALETPVSDHVTLLTYNGESLSVDKWAKKLGISRRIIKYRLYEKGWSVSEALSTPVRSARK